MICYDAENPSIVAEALESDPVLMINPVHISAGRIGVLMPERACGAPAMRNGATRLNPHRGTWTISSRVTGAGWPGSIAISRIPLAQEPVK